MKLARRAVPLLAAAVLAASAPIRADDARPSPRHVYLRVPPRAADPDAVRETRARGIASSIEAFLGIGEPAETLRERVEASLDGHFVVRWTVTAWTPEKALKKISRVRALFRPEEGISIEAAPIVTRTVEVKDAAALANKLKTDGGAAEEWFRERFGPSFPVEMLKGRDGGSFFDFSAVRDGTPGLDAAGVLFDATGRPRAGSEIDELIRLARAKPRAENPGVGPGREPPPPLAHDGFVMTAAAGDDARDELRSLIYASRGYEGGFGKGSGLYGPMALSKATFDWAMKEAGAAQKEILAKGLHDPEANVLAGAIILERLKAEFGGDLSRAVAAFHVGAGNVRKHGGIPPDAKHFLSRFRLAHQQGVRRALDPASPRAVRKIEPEKPVSPIAAIIRRIREESIAFVRGEPPTGRRESFDNVPPALASEIRQAAVDKGWQTDPNALIALAEAEGGVNAGTSHANARGVLQITPETGLWECGLSRAELADRAKNIACAEKVFANRLAKAGGDIVLAWALYNTKVKWHDLMIEERRVASIRETVRHVTRAAYRYFQLTGDTRFDPGSRAFREKYFTSRQALAWSADSYRDVQRWDRNEGFTLEEDIRDAEPVPALEGDAGAGPATAPGRWRRNSTGTHWYRSSRAPGRRWDLHPYRDRSGSVTTPPV